LDVVEMKNRNVGFLIIGLAVVIAALVFLFDNTMKSAIAQSCTHGPTCSMYAAVNTQTWVALIVVGVVLLIGLFLVFAKENERIVLRTKRITEKRKPISLEGLDKNEKRVIGILQSENGAIFQSTLMEKLGIGKVGLTRLLDKLEAKQLIERKRRGMNNIVVLK
jgi:uncharacterized membrane protein